MLQAEGGRLTLSVHGHRVTLPDPNRLNVGTECQILLRPEAAQLAKTGLLPCRVTYSCFMGAYQNYHVMVGDTLIKVTESCPINKRIFQVGEEAFLSFEEDSVHLLDEKEPPELQ